MQNRTLKNLEYNKIISLLSSNCVTYIGKEIAEKLLPSNDIETVQMLQTETKEACSFSLRKNSVPLSPIANLENIINKLNVGGGLNIEELLTIATTLKISREIN